MKKDRTGMFMDVTFKYPGDEKEYSESVYIPFPIFMQAVRKYCEDSMVTLDGTDNAVWNLLVDFGCLDNLEDDADIQEYCRELYKGTEYEEEDYEFWKDEYEMLHDLGEYALEEK